MLTRRSIWPLLVVVAILAGPSVASAQVPSREQQKCLEILGKSALKLAKLQGRENRSCVRGVSAQRLDSSGEACLATDARGKLAKAEDKTLANEAKRCTGAGLPDFGSAGGDALNAAARQAETDLIHDLFGEPIDPGVALCSSDRDACRCQGKVQSAVEKLFSGLGKAHRVCKKKRLKTGDIGAGADLEACIDDPGVGLSLAADAKGKLARARQKLATAVAKRCDAPGVAATSFPGVCDGLDADPLADCLAESAACRFCQLVNAAEGTVADCDAFDDAAANASCDPLSCPAGESACPGGCTSLDDDEANCGGCGVICGPGETCSFGVCGP